MIYSRDGSARVLRSGDSIDAQDVVPGFSLSLAALFSG